ncbi:carboxypeptidase-like regulatory domain-containing protein [Nannocystis punicea]|uniref:Carboxypeptidase-like regulatory domain-containing protein n=1 Tax=Nannocystis punicea TaxID=2995304 RepID=A0ABY7H1J9_9BACT|nr:carboxypeptidase-like regulatory domain-containing protein [Nannocystis poenicansa]WAS93133.1 carboxypeptidase-like regulatory domain-containing protein [Nannocystis poenicansa]
MEPAIAAAGPGPAYVLVEHVGVLRIEDDEVTTALPLAGGDARDLELAAGPEGSLWASGWDGVEVLPLAGEARTVHRRGGSGPRYEHLQVRADNDVWAVTSDIEWQVVHYDGSRWQPTRARRQAFKGKYDDNKFEGLALDAEGVWVSSWNGLWRGVGDDWRPIDAPPGTGTILSLWSYRGRPIVGDGERWFLRDGGDWRPLSWPITDDVRRAVGEVGVVAAPEHGRAAVRLAAVTAASCTAASEPLAGSRVSALAVDGSGRVWLATDVGLGVIDGDGRRRIEWPIGSLPGFSGRPLQVVVIGAGPWRLPSPRPARTWEVVGRLRTFKQSAPLAGAAVELCPSPSGSDRCPPGPGARAATTAADGAFRFADVPIGDYSIVVRPPADHPACRSPFTRNGHSLAPAVDCPPDAARCDLGELTDCRPFEMPPPPR